MATQDGFPKNIASMEALFSSEVMRGRYAKSLGITLLLQTLVSALLCSFFHVVIYEGTWNPYTLVVFLGQGCMTPTWLLPSFLPALSFIFLTRIHIQSYTLYWWIPEKRIKYLTNVLKPKNILYSCAFSFISCLLVQHYFSRVIPDSITLTKPCSERKDLFCVNHRAVFVLWTGFLLGCHVSYKYFLSNYRVIEFPPSETNCLVSLKTKLRLRALFEACAGLDIGFGFLVVAFSSYVLAGLSGFLDTLMFSTPDPNSLIFDILTIVFDAKFIMLLVLCLCLVAYHFHCFFIIFNENVTRRFELPISCFDERSVKSSSELEVCTLANGLVSSNDLLLHLAFRHFKDLSQDATPWGSSYRAQVFTISQPGGHPHNWQNVLKPSLDLIRGLTEKLRAVNGSEETHIASISQMMTDAKKNPSKPFSFSLKLKFVEFLQGLKQYPIFCYLLFELPDAKNRQIFAQCQPVIWAIQGLANLTAASYSDDQFGVVQKDLGAILTAFTRLQQAVDNVGRGVALRRSVVGPNLGSKARKYPLDLQLRRSLRLTIRSSLYLIANTFQQSIRDVAVSEDVRMKMDSYLEFRE